MSVAASFWVGADSNAAVYPAHTSPTHAAGVTRLLVGAYVVGVPTTSSAPHTVRPVATVAVTTMIHWNRMDSPSLSGARPAPFRQV